MLPLSFIFEQLKHATFCLPLKGALLDYVANAYLDVEKSLGDDYDKSLINIINYIIGELYTFCKLKKKMRTDELIDPFVLS